MYQMSHNAMKNKGLHASWGLSYTRTRFGVLYGIGGKWGARTPTCCFSSMAYRCKRCPLPFWQLSD